MSAAPHLRETGFFCTPETKLSACGPSGSGVLYSQEQLGLRSSDTVATAKPGPVARWCPHYTATAAPWVAPRAPSTGLDLLLTASPVKQNQATSRSSQQINLQSARTGCKRITWRYCGDGSSLIKSAHPLAATCCRALGDVLKVHAEPAGNWPKYHVIQIIISVCIHIKNYKYFLQILRLQSEMEPSNEVELQMLQWSIQFGCFQMRGPGWRPPGRWGRCCGLCSWGAGLGGPSPRGRSERAAGLSIPRLSSRCWAGGTVSG